MGQKVVGRFRQKVCVRVCTLCPSLNMKAWTAVNWRNFFLIVHCGLMRQKAGPGVGRQKTCVCILTWLLQHIFDLLPLMS